MQSISHVGYVKSIQQSASAVAKYPNTCDSRPHLLLLVWRAAPNFSRWVPSKPHTLQELCLPLKSIKRLLYLHAVFAAGCLPVAVLCKSARGELGIWGFGLKRCWRRDKQVKMSSASAFGPTHQIELFEWAWRWGQKLSQKICPWRCSFISSWRSSGETPGLLK